MQIDANVLMKHFDDSLNSIEARVAKFPEDQQEKIMALIATRFSVELPIIANNVLNELSDDIINSIEIVNNKE